jgi:PTS system fructose-specific IIC component
MLIVGLGMNFIVEPVVGTINGWMNDALKYLNGTNAVVILGLIVAGMMAVDMGGPVNKAAYVFATGMLAEGHYNIMAAVMIGGMVPPIAIAAATLIFKNKFTAEERKAGPVNFVMGAAFITEGAIPYAAADPAHVLPACIVGSALAGALSMAFKCTLMAPHGGVFVFPVVGNPVMYVVALLIGSAVGCLLLGLLKKNVEE